MQTFPHEDRPHEDRPHEDRPHDATSPIRLHDPRVLAVLAHLGAVLLPFALPFALYLTTKREPFARAAAAQAATLQAFVCLLSYVAPALASLLWIDPMWGAEGPYLPPTFQAYLPISMMLPFAVHLPFMIVAIVGAIRSSRGEPYRIPLIGGVVERLFGAFPRGAMDE
ncbi:MAG: DUF4870 domain-containing protein [Polyangiaceae bacterium]|nr:DUF4870 domain-containing protein [Polyangiaceae bacterium]